MNTSPEIKEICEALAKAQSELRNISKDGDNPFFKSKYATLEHVLNEVKPVLEKHGLFLAQSAPYMDNVILCRTRIFHTSGQWIETAAGVYVEKLTAQGSGAAISYARRYGLLAALALGSEDDDAESTMRPSDKVKDKFKGEEVLTLETLPKATKDMFRKLGLTKKEVKDYCDVARWNLTTINDSLKEDIRLQGDTK